MIDFLIESVQVVCFVGLLCGAYYSIRYDRERAPERPRENALAMPVACLASDTIPHAHV
jgi:hypothetical protein